MKRSSKIVAILLVILATGGYVYSQSKGFSKSDLKTGDVIFQTLDSELSSVIVNVTESRLAHCGMVIREKNGDLFVIEAVGPVRILPFDNFINNGIDHNFAVARLKDSDGIDFEKVVAEAKKFLGRPYDFQYRFDDEHMYCSELVYKAYMKAANLKIAKTVKLKDLKYKDSIDFIKKLAGGEVPLEREMVTPVDIYRSDLFEKVYSSY